MDTILKSLGILVLAVANVIGHIYVAQQAFNVLMVHFGFEMISFTQAWVTGSVLGMMSGSTRISLIIKKEAKEDTKMLLLYGLVAIPFELFSIHIINYVAF